MNYYLSLEPPEDPRVYTPQFDSAPDGPYVYVPTFGELLKEFGSAAGMIGTTFRETLRPVSEAMARAFSGITVHWALPPPPAPSYDWVLRPSPVARGITHMHLTLDETGRVRPWVPARFFNADKMPIVRKRDHECECFSHKEAPKLDLDRLVNKPVQPPEPLRLAINADLPEHLTSDHRFPPFKIVTEKRR